MEIKEDTYAILKVIKSDGTSIPLFDQSSETGTASETASFIIQAAQEVRMEKHQIIETFGDSYIFFFGEAPRFIDVSSVLINSNDFNWEAEWWENYEKYLRGTRSVELGARTYLFVDDSIIEGFMLQAQSTKTSDSPLSLTLNFRLFVTNYRNVSLVGDPNFPIRASIVLPESVPSLSQPLNSEQINALVGSASGLDSNGFAQGGFDLNINSALRGKIVDNFDEYTGTSNPPPDVFEKLLASIQEGLELADSLMQESIERLSDLGADVNNPDFMQAVGLGPNFNFSSGISIGAGARFNASSSFGTSGGGGGFGASAGAGIGFGTSPLTGSSFGGSFGSGSVFGGSFIGSTASFSTPGKSSKVGSSAGASYGGGIGSGASTMVGGSPSAFAMASFEGELDLSGAPSEIVSASVGF